MATVRSLILLVLLLAITSPSAHAQRKYGLPFPTDKPLGISVIHDTRKPSLLPVGTYTIPNSSYHFYSYKKGVQFAQFFGVVGAVVGGLKDINSKKNAKNSASQEEIYSNVNLDSITTKLLQDNLQSQSKHSLVSDSSKNNLLKVRPSSWVFLVGENYEMAFEVEAYYVDEKGDQIWKGQYSYVVPDDLPLVGPGGMVEDGGVFLRQLAQRGLSRCVESLLNDIKGKEAQWLNETKLPPALKEFPKGNLFLNLPKGCVLLKETNEDWVITQPIQYQGDIVKIISKSKERLVAHPVRKAE